MPPSVWGGGLGRVVGLDARGNFHTYINNNPNSKRYHPAMYAQFARILVSLGKTVPGWEDDRATW